MDVKCKISSKNPKTNDVCTGVCYKVGTVCTAICLVFLGNTMINRASEQGELMLVNSCYDSPSTQYIKTDIKGGCNEWYSELSIDLLQIENINKINLMSKFEADWNGTWGRVFSQKAIARFRTIIETLDKQPQIAPTGRNSLLMQYELENKSILAFEVCEDKVEKVFVPCGNYSNAKVEVFTDNFEQQIKESVKLFYGKG